MTKVQMPSGRPLGRIVCPHCGNDKEFIEVARNVVVTTKFVQNNDGSFTPLEDDSEVTGKVELYCGQCDADVSFFHNHLTEMLF